MTETEWLACERAVAMLDWLARLPAPPRRRRAPAPGPARPSGRKLRLFACACCRQAWGKLTGPHRRRAVEAAERFAEGEVTRKELDAAAARALRGLTGELKPAWMAYRACESRIDFWNFFANRHAIVQSEIPPDPAAVALLRDIINPFRPAAPAGAFGGVPLSLAQAAYEERQLPSGHLDGARLAVLADALEDAGCADDTLLSHLRSPGPHVRGCWALDLVLGKE